jgi:hypothetical protein
MRISMIHLAGLLATERELRGMSRMPLGGTAKRRRGEEAEHDLHWGAI